MFVQAFLRYQSTAFRSFQGIGVPYSRQEAVLQAFVYIVDNIINKFINMELGKAMSLSRMCIELSE